MVSIRKTTGAVLAGLVLAVSLSQAAAPTSVLAYAPASQGQQDVAAQQGPVSLTRTDEAYDGTSVPMVSLLEERQFQASVPVGGKSLDELAELVSEGKVGWSLTRTQGQFGTDAYPNQFMGGPLSDWKTVATENGPAESGNGLGEEGSGTLPSRDLFYDVSVEAKEVDGVPSIVLGFKNHLLYEGIDGIDVRARESVRSSLYDYVGTYRLACAIDGGEVGSTDLQLRPYDEFSTQEDDAELPELAQQAIDNGLYAEVRQFGTTVDGRAMRALFVAKEKADLDRYQELKGRMESDPASVQAELASGSLDYKVPVVYSNVHADEIVAPDSVMAFARDLVRNQPLGYRRAASLTDEGKSELATEMDHDRTVWSDLIKDDVTGIGYLRGNGGSGRGTNYDGPDTDTASSDLSEDELSRYYNVEDKTFVPSVALDDMFFILVPSENVDARTDNVRTNANGFDLNRDNTYQTQPETQAMSGLIAQWDPLSLHEVHGYYQQYQVEPCSPTHDPNNEYDLFVDTALAQGEAFMASSIASNETINSVQMPMRDYLKLQGDGTRFWEMPFDDMSTSYTPQYAMMHGTNAYTVEAPYGTSAAVRAADGDWRGINLHVFDVPQATGDLYQRLATLETWLREHPQARIRVIAQTPVKNREHITSTLKTIEQQGGEGLMLREPNQPYHGGRSPYLLKVKSAPDAECTVVAHHPGKGKHTGRLGAITCENEHGRFRIGSGFTDAERAHPPAIGSTITYRYRGFTRKGTPRFATYLRPRADTPPAP